jgi:hypothetical protein
MSTFGEFTSLLQLGFGIGIGLSLFRAPVDLRAAKIARILDMEMTALRGVATAFGQQKRRKLMSLKLRFLDAQKELERQQFPFLIFTLLGALINLLLLIKASVSAQQQVTPSIEWLLIFISVIYFVFIVIILDCIARRKLTPLMNDLSDLRSLVS